MEMKENDDEDEEEMFTSVVSTHTRENNSMLISSLARIVCSLPQRNGNTIIK
jgi:hypothetical protein